MSVFRKLFSFLGRKRKEGGGQDNDEPQKPPLQIPILPFLPPGISSSSRQGAEHEFEEGKDEANDLSNEWDIPAPAAQNPVPNVGSERIWEKTGFYLVFDVNPTEAFEKHRELLASKIEDPRLEIKLERNAQIALRSKRIQQLQEEIAEMRKELAQSVFLQSELEKKLELLHTREYGLKVLITQEREALAVQRDGLSEKVMEVQNKEVSASIALAQSAHQKQSELNAEHFQSQHGKIKRMTDWLEAELGKVQERRGQVQQEILDLGFVFGRNLKQKLVVGSALAGLTGWATSIVTGDTGFDDATILEELVIQLLNVACKYRGEWYDKFGFLALWVGIFIVMALLMIATFNLLGYVSRKLSGESLESPPNSGSIGQKAAIQPESEEGSLEGIMEFKPLAWTKHFKENLFVIIAPIWFLLGLLLVFFPTDESNLETAENSVSGFLIGLAWSWVLALLGYYVFFPRAVQSQVPELGNWSKFVRNKGQVIIAIIGGMVGIMVIAHFLGATQKVVFGLGLLFLFSTVSIIVGGRIIKAYFLGSEDNDLGDMEKEVTQRLSRLSSPWTTYFDVTTTTGLRRQLKSFFQNQKNLQNERFASLLSSQSGRKEGRYSNGNNGNPDKSWASGGQSKGKSLAEGQPKDRIMDVSVKSSFVSSILVDEYFPEDHYYFVETVGKIESLKRLLLEIIEHIAIIENEMLMLREGRATWQVNLRKRIGSCNSQIGTLLQDNIQERILMGKEEAEALLGLAILEAALRKGFENGLWYQQNGCSIGGIMTIGENVQPNDQGEK